MLISILILSYPISTVHASVNGTVYYVTQAGADNDSCGSSSSPCRSIQFAVNKAASGDAIRVGSGTYLYSAASDNCKFLVTSSVVCVLDKNLVIQGGYSSANWSSANPQVNVTTIDGENTRRGIAVISYNNNVTLTMDGFTVQNGLSQGDPNSDGTGRGGGLWAQKSAVILSNMQFKNNRSVGANGYGAPADGGAVMIESTNSGSSSLSNVVFDGNQAIGGSSGHGVDRGGFAIGGAIFTYQATMSGSYLTMINNVARAGSSSSSGRDSSNLTADALGGAGGFQLNSNISLTNINAENNQAYGGNAGGSGTAGAGLGGAIHIEGSTLKITGARLQNNLAQGGSAGVGGLAMGGALMTDRVNATLDRIWLVNNQVKSGTGANASVDGGGAYLANFGADGSYTAVVTNSVFADNQLIPSNTASTLGSGGGLTVRGIQANLSFDTFARNTMGSNSYLCCGIAISVLSSQGGSGTPGKLSLQNSIISDHPINAASSIETIFVWKNSTATLANLMTANNGARLTNESDYPPNSGIFTETNIIPVTSIDYVSMGSPQYDYHLKNSSPAIDKAASSAITDDIDGDNRPYGNASDLGADELTPSMLQTVPNSLSVMVDSRGYSSNIHVVDNKGNLIHWTASTQASWISLGSGSLSSQISGYTGDWLLVSINPKGLPLGTYETTISFTSLDAIGTSLRVNIIVVDKVYRTFLPELSN